MHPELVLTLLCGSCLATEATLIQGGRVPDVRPPRLELVAEEGGCAEQSLTVDGPAVLVDLTEILNEGELTLPMVETLEFRGELELPLQWCPTPQAPRVDGMIFLAFEDMASVAVPVQGVLK